MKRLKRVVIWILVLILAEAFAVTAFGAPSQAEEGVISATASNLTSQLDEASAAGRGGVNIVGIVCWVVIGLGVLFIIYVLFSSNRKKTGVRPKQMKYRRSPYRKNHRRMQNEYYQYKRNKYK